ncbi:response regulator [Synoicihabitans lomoniglobus]|uniref:Response regulator n=1 Tax=Synoicihabitans lomoniglobus TaxID=2909285 RepID=A0AAE9ZZK5_9BACT|nr:response regulator [Opitutaceae bacterium LMO-M01]WED65753.1 response regulator [Opitutaceae bacterium LMO-M01]
MTSLPQILLVEDSQRDAELAMDALEENHISNDILWVRDGEEALDFLFARGDFANRPPGNPAVVLLDLKMPKVDGLEVLRTVRANPELSIIPFVMMTSSREERDMVTSYELGVNAYVVKPVQFNEFVEAVKTVGRFWAVLNERPRNSS